MRDFIYIDAETESIVVVCLALKHLYDADYHFKDVIGVWPWMFKHVYTKSEPTEVEDVYILE